MDAVGTNIRLDSRGRQVLRALPRVNDDVNEEWASDKTRHAVDGLVRKRLDRPYVRKDGKLVPASWDEAFAAIAEHGGFAAAARVLGKDPSVLSRRIDVLERRLGVRLFARTTRKVGLTEVGAAYLQKVRVILAELTAADVEAAEGAARPRRPGIQGLRLGGAHVRPEAAEPDHRRPGARPRQGGEAAPPHGQHRRG